MICFMFGGVFQPHLGNLVKHKTGFSEIYKIKLILDMLIDTNLSLSPKLQYSFLKPFFCLIWKNHRNINFFDEIIKTLLYFEISFWTTVLQIIYLISYQENNGTAIIHLIYSVSLST